MKIAVCIKQVPDTEAEIKWDTPKGILKRNDMSPITNPFDEFALEEALLSKEKCDGDIVAITMGPEKAGDVLRNALALTVNEVYRCTDDAFAGSDTYANRSCLPLPLRRSAVWTSFFAENSLPTEIPASWAQR